MLQYVLVHGYGLLQLAATTQQTAHCQVRLERVRTDVEIFDESCNCPIRLVVQQVIDALVVVWSKCLRGFHLLTAPQPPANADGQNYEQVKRPSVHGGGVQG